MSIADIANTVTEVVSDAARAVGTRATTAYLTLPMALVPAVAEAHPSEGFHVHGEQVVQGGKIALAAAALLAVAGTAREILRGRREYRSVLAAQDFEETGYGSPREARRLFALDAFFYGSMAGAVATWATPVVMDMVQYYR